MKRAAPFVVGEQNIVAFRINHSHGPAQVVVDDRREDQAEALAALPAPWQGIERDAVVSKGQNTSLHDSKSHEEDTDANNRSPANSEASVTDCQSDSADAESANGWRRRELNPRPAMHPR